MIQKLKTLFRKKKQPQKHLTLDNVWDNYLTEDINEIKTEVRFDFLPDIVKWSFTNQKKLRELFWLNSIIINKLIKLNQIDDIYTLNNNIDMIISFNQNILLKDSNFLLREHFKKYYDYHKSLIGIFDSITVISAKNWILDFLIKCSRDTYNRKIKRINYNYKLHLFNIRTIINPKWYWKIYYSIFKLKQ